jgi:epoxide hydrolase-like predicted phosphatase
MFDIGGVIMSSERSFDGIYEEFADVIGAPREKVVKLHNDYLNRMLYGKVSAAQFFALVKKKVHVKGDLKNIWINIAMKHITLNEELLGMIDRLRVGRPVALLSNVSQIRSFVDERFNIYEHFDHRFLSYKLKMQKPSRRIYHYALKKLKIKPEEALFIDDKESNLRVARELGFKCIQFNNNAQLMTELVPFSLL